MKKILKITYILFALVVILTVVFFYLLNSLRIIEYSKCEVLIENGRFSVAISGFKLNDTLDLSISGETMQGIVVDTFDGKRIIQIPGTNFDGKRIVFISTGSKTVGQKIIETYLKRLHVSHGR